MRVHTKVVVDIETGRVIEDDCQEYPDDLPLALCDRSIQAGAGQAGKTAGTDAGGYQSQADAAYGAGAPTMFRWAGGQTPGFGAIGLADMQNAAMSSAAAARGAGEETARLRAMRTGNAAALPAEQTAAAAGAARAGGSALQNILAKNAMLKEHQQEVGLRGTMGLYGAAGKQQLGEQELQNQLMRTQLQAGRSGWLQNMMGLMAAGGAGATGAGSFLTGFGQR